MRVLIAGGNGYIGALLTRTLLGAGHEVGWLSHRPGRVVPPESVTETALQDPAVAVGDADALVNLSGYPIASRWNGSVKRLLRESRVDTTRALVDAIRTARSSGCGPSVLVNASGIGIYGDGGDDELDEGAPVGGDWLADLAVDWEREALAASDAGCRVVVMRTGLVLGSEGLLPKLVTPMRFFAGGPIGDGRQWVPWIHEADIAEAYRFALERTGLTGAINACAPSPVRMSELMRTLGRVMHRPPWLPVPRFALRLALGEVAPYTLMSQRAFPRALVEAGFSFAFPDLESALIDLLA